MQKTNAKKFPAVDYMYLKYPSIHFQLVPLHMELVLQACVELLPGIRLSTFRSICKISATDLYLLLCHFSILLMTLHASYELSFLCITRISYTLTNAIQGV